METQTTPDDPAKHDEDVKFERDKEAAIVPLTESGHSGSPTGGEPIPPAKEDTMGKGDLKPLSADEKLPKLPDDKPAERK